MVQINEIGVLGAGLMGHGVAQCAAQAGYQVVLVDISQPELDKGMAKIEAALTKDVKKEKITSVQKDEVLGRISCSTDTKQFAQCDLVIESIPESMDLKKKVFSELDQICKPEAIIATNTSQLCVTEIASATKRPEKVCGMHFFFPVQVMKLVEVIEGEHTSRECTDTVVAVSKKLRKETCVCRDTPGFIVNRLLGSFLSEASRMYDEQLASIEEIDKAVKFALGHPMGPFQLFDLSGIDTIAHVANGLREGLGERFMLGTGVRNKVSAGDFGQKTGKGFYNYNK